VYEPLEVMTITTIRMGWPAQTMGRQVVTVFVEVIAIAIAIAIGYETVAVG
jgi:hypothetical protein